MAFITAFERVGLLGPPHQKKACIKEYLPKLLLSLLFVPYSDVKHVTCSQLNLGASSPNHCSFSVRNELMKWFCSFKDVWCMLVYMCFPKLHGSARSICRLCGTHFRFQLSISAPGSQACPFTLWWGEDTVCIDVLLTAKGLFPRHLCIFSHPPLTTKSHNNSPL